MAEILTSIARFQTLIAGTFAIIAALIAFGGIVWLANHNKKEQSRSVAAAIWSELASIGTRLFADMRNIRNTSSIFAPHMPPPLNIAIFNSDASAVGRLPAEEAYMVTLTYKLILDLNERYNKYGASGARSEIGLDLADDVERVVKQIGVTLRGLYRTAGIPKDKANAALKLWTAEIDASTT